MSKFLIVALMLAFTMHSKAANLNGFTKRFEIIKEDGKLKMIRDKSLKNGFKVAPLLKHYSDSLSELKVELTRKNALYEIEELIFEDMYYEKGERNSENLRIVMKSIENLQHVDLEKIYSSSKFKEVLGMFEGKVSNALEALDTSVIAHAQNPTYFFKKRAIYNISKMVLDFAKKRLSTIPVLNTASHLLLDAEKMIRERRTFHQNMLLYYFSHHEHELGLEPAEWDSVLSSIYESRIPWFSFWQSKDIAANWKTYGVSSFAAQVKAANFAVSRMSRSRRAKMGNRVNFAFQQMKNEKGEEVIVNLFDQEGMFKKGPAVAFYVNSPKKIARKRMILQLASFGMSFLPIKDTFKELANNFLKSHYETQRLTEGSLYGYFEANNDVEGMKNIKGQYLNPFDSL